MHTRTQHSCSRGEGGSVSTPYRRTMVRRRRCRVTNWDWSRLTRFFSLSRGGASAAKTGLTRRRRQTSILFSAPLSHRYAVLPPSLCVSWGREGKTSYSSRRRPLLPPPSCVNVCVYCRHRSTPSLVSSSVSPRRMCHTVYSADELGVDLTPKIGEFVAASLLTNFAYFFCSLHDRIPCGL